MAGLKFRRSAASAEAEMDITPMIDCTFLLLIFFLVASHMDSAVHIELPPAKHGTTVVMKESIVLTVAKGPGEFANVYRGDGIEAKNIFVASNVVEQEEAIAKYVADEALGPPSKRYVLIKAEADVKHGDVARVQKAAARAEVEQLYVGVMETQ
jgi:biopolymer transport protein ExbD